MASSSATVEGVQLVTGSLAQLPIVLQVSGKHFGSCCYWNETTADECLCGMRGPSSIHVQVGSSQVGEVQCHITLVRSNTQLLCELQQPSTEQMQEADTITVTSGGQQATAMFSYLLLVGNMFIDSVRILDEGNFSTVLGGTVVVSGRGFTANQGFLEMYNGINENGSVPERQWQRMTGVSLWTASSIHVRLPPGQGDLLIRAGMGGSPGSISFEESFSYPQPTISRVLATPIPTSGHWSTQTRQVQTQGTFVLIEGINFGAQQPLRSDLPQYLASGERASPGCAGAGGGSGGTCTVEALPGANSTWLGTKQCAVRSWNHTTITFFAPDGVGSPQVSIHVFQVLVMGRPSSLDALESTYQVSRTQLSVSYEGPSVQSVMLSTERAYPIPSNGMSPAVGGGSVAVRGTSFGTPELLEASDMKLRVLLDGESVTNITSHDHALVTFIAPAGTGSLGLVVLVGTLASTPFEFVYDAPMFSALRNIGDGDKARHLLSIMAATGLHPHNSSLSFLDTSSTSQVVVAAPGSPVGAAWSVPFLPSDVQSTVLALDARGSEFQLSGWNFAVSAPSNASILVGSVACNLPTGFTNAWTGDSTMVCVLPAMTVGRKSLQINILQTQLFVPAEVSPVFVVCDAGFYGVTPEVDFCEACPTCRFEPCHNSGASCEGAWTLPRPTSGFWQLNLSMPLPTGWLHMSRQQAAYTAAARQQLRTAGINSTAIVQQRLQTQSTANLSDISKDRWLHVPCMPEGACAPDNACTQGYTGVSCRDCEAGFYRSSGLSNAGHCISCGARDIALWLLLPAVAILAPVAFALNQVVQ